MTVVTLVKGSVGEEDEQKGEWVGNVDVDGEGVSCWVVTGVQVLVQQYMDFGESDDQVEWKHRERLGLCKWPLMEKGK